MIPTETKKATSAGGLFVCAARQAAINTKPTLQAVTSSAENNPEISVQRIEVDIVREELLDENDVT
jgi:hypothetical protein